MENKILSRKETAKLLKISLPTLHKLVKTKVIVAYRLGRKIYFLENEVLSSLKSVNY